MNETNCSDRGTLIKAMLKADSRFMIGYATPSGGFTDIFRINGPYEVLWFDGVNQPTVTQFKDIDKAVAQYLDYCGR